MATTIPETVTTIPAGTLRLLLTSISYRAKARKEIRRQPSMVPHRPPRPCHWTAPPGGGCQGARQRSDQPLTRCQIASRRAWEASRPRRADPVQVDTLTHRRMRRAQHLPAIRTQWEKTPPGWHGLRYAALSGMEP